MKALRRTYPFKEREDVSSLIPWIRRKEKDIKSVKLYRSPPSACGFILEDPLGKQTLLYANLSKLLLYNCLALQGNTGVTSQIEIILKTLSMKEILIPKSEQIRDYLLRYPSMIDLLLPICQELRERFKEHTQLSLELYIDPEIDDQYLVFYVRQDNYATDILDVIEDVSKEFEIELSERSGYLLITTDFKIPG